MLKELFNRFIGNFNENLRGRFPVATVDYDAIKGYNKKRKASLTGSFCYAPGINMLFGQDGKVRACCHNMEFTLGEYPKQSIAEIWKSKAAEELRSHVKNYDLTHGCDVCAADMNTRSYDEVRAWHFDSLPINQEYPTMMEFLMTNTCNLECVMCKGEYSSLIRKNRDKLPPLVSPYDKEFIKQVEEFIPYLHETRFSGSGEAFAIDINYELWEMIIRLNPKCIIMVQSNGSFLNARIKDLLSRGNFRIGVSLDSLQKENYESIRLNANFDRVMENIRYFSEYSRSKNEKFALALCVMRQNWHELPAFIDFCNANNAEATLHKVWYPSEYALNNLTVIELTAIHTYLAGFDFRAKTRLEQKNRRHYHYMVSVIKGWMEEKYVFALEELAAVGVLREEQIFDFFKTKISDYLATTGIGKEEHTSLLKLCMDKTRTRFAGHTQKLREIEKMNEAKLFNYLENRIGNYLKASVREELDRGAVLNLCMNKIRMGFAQYGDNEGRVAALRMACMVAVAPMVDSLKENAVEDLVEQVKA